jgi:hypothetical protein
MRFPVVLTVRAYKNLSVIARAGLCHCQFPTRMWTGFCSTASDKFIDQAIAVLLSLASGGTAATPHHKLRGRNDWLSMG